MPGIKHILQKLERLNSLWKDGEKHLPVTSKEKCLDFKICMELYTKKPSSGILTQVLSNNFTTKPSQGHSSLIC